MTDDNGERNSKAEDKRTGTGRAARTVSKTTAEAKEGARSKGAAAARTAESAGRATGAAAESAGRATGSAAKSAGQAAGESAEVAGKGVTTALKGVEAGRKAVTSAASQAGAMATTAWTVLKHRRIIAAGAAAGLAVLSVGSYAVGRRAERGRRGPVARLSGGRL